MLLLCNLTIQNTNLNQFLSRIGSARRSYYINLLSTFHALWDFTEWTSVYSRKFDSPTKGLRLDRECRRTSDLDDCHDADGQHVRRGAGASRDPAGRTRSARVQRAGASPGYLSPLGYRPQESLVQEAHVRSADGRQPEPHRARPAQSTQLARRPHEIQKVGHTHFFVLKFLLRR